MKYTINGTGYKNKNEIKVAARQYLGSKTKHELTGEAREFFLALLIHHDEFNTKINGVDSFDDVHLVYENMFSVANAPSWGLRLYFGDKWYRGDDISWNHAVHMLSVPTKQS